GLSVGRRPCNCHPTNMAATCAPRNQDCTFAQEGTPTPTPTPGGAGCSSKIKIYKIATRRRAVSSTRPMLLSVVCCFLLSGSAGSTIAEELVVSREVTALPMPTVALDQSSTNHVSSSDGCGPSASVMTTVSTPSGSASSLFTNAFRICTSSSRIWTEISTRPV